MAKYSVGIDLGTTNCVLAYVDLADEGRATKVLSLPQLVDAGTIESLGSLPSFLFVATQQEQASNSLDLPWSEQPAFAVGELARKRSAEQPERTVSAAKSWLCHHRVDRYSAILPWNAPAEVGKLSPVAVTTQYLSHVRAAWDQAFPDALLEEQLVTLTVPASFDPSARELTREAAMSAGFPADLLMLEEPQAAVYNWLQQSGEDWRKKLKQDEVILVCDVGGGTTDLTLIQAVDESGDLELRRLAVGEHLLVGGDNMDLAVAHYVAERFTEKGVKLDPWQSVSLWHSCREAKEALLGADEKETHTISLLGRGSKLIGGTVTVDVGRDDIQALLLDGFFPKCKKNDKPVAHVQSGFQEIGLPYAADTAITRHVANFINQDETPTKPTHILFNGGVFRSTTLVERCQEVVNSWFGSKFEANVLNDEESLNQAVASGAAYYGWCKDHGGIRIRGGTARSFYVGIETSGLAIPGAPRPLNALCVVPQGMEEGTECDVPSTPVGLVVGEAARFRFFDSSQRKSDMPGDLVTDWTSDELTELPVLEATLDEVEEVTEAYVPVQFESRVTELGMLELWCVHGEHRWKLEFNVRGEE